ncbi:MAG: polysaccharide pyruvyl transferase family protein [Bacilli bacterium]|nr:polysaccharide pyruvyl transferase family protein [Bacilli bacterium]
MKKVGIITFYNAYNYGAFLQTFATQKVLENKFDVSVIQYSCKDIKKHYRLIKTVNIKKFAKSILFLPHNIKRKAKFLRCINTKLSLKDITSKFDYVIAGSDQIWNINLTGGYDNVYSLEYFKNAKKISYASSIGDETLVQKNKDIYNRILNNIDNISVREESAKEELNKISDKKIKVNLDPTLLLTKEEWKTYVTSNPISDSYIFSYFVGVTQDNYDALNRLSKKFNMPVVSYSENPKENNIIKHCYTDDPFEFITKIKDADFIFVSSFHATVFSIIFNKEFYCMPPKDKGNRIINLLKKLGLESRIIYDKDDIDKIDLYEKIDYEPVNKKLNEYRKDSLEWLVKSLEE